jgi:hypothetical protein
MSLKRRALVELLAAQVDWTSTSRALCLNLHLEQSQIVIALVFVDNTMNLTSAQAPSKHVGIA